MHHYRFSVKAVSCVRYWCSSCSMCEYPVCKTSKRCIQKKQCETSRNNKPLQYGSKQLRSHGDLVDSVHVKSRIQDYDIIHVC
eukprot:m.355212 g.355212  ORF g.355212 m.355212 type:complete len:83 (-) comp17197_c0_seq1:72-320(-)